MSKPEKNLWPYGIVIILAGVVVLIVYTINFATKAKVQDETAFFQDYRQVDFGINEIQIAHQEFIKKYAFTPVSKQFEIGENRLQFQLESKSGDKVDQAGTKILLTRPHTNEQNQDLEVEVLEDGLFTSKPFNVEGKGRWKVQYFIQIGEDKGFFSQEIKTTM